MKKVYRFLSNINLKEREKVFKEIGTEIQIDFSYIYYQDLVYITGLGLYHSEKGLIENLDGAWITGNGSSDFKKSISYLFSKFTNTKILDSRNRKMLDDSKLSQIIFLDKNGFNIPKSFFAYIDNKWVSLLEENISYPIVAKDIHLDRGEGVFLIKDRVELLNFFQKEEGKPYLFQQYIKNNGDWRVLVVGDKVLGGFKRYNDEDFKNNFSQGGKAEFVEPPIILKEKAIKICKGFEIEIGGIDFFYENGEYYVIEINRTPQTNAFRQKYGNLYEKEVLKLFKKSVD